MLSNIEECCCWLLLVFKPLDDDEVEARGSEDILVGMPVKAMPRLSPRLSSPLLISLLAPKPPFGWSISPDEEGDDDVDGAVAAFCCCTGRMSSPFRVGSDGRSGRLSRNLDDDADDEGAEVEVAGSPALAAGSPVLLDDDVAAAAADGGYCSGSRRCNWISSRSTGCPNDDSASIPWKEDDKGASTRVAAEPSSEDGSG